MIVIDRYNPRTDREALKEIFEDFIENKSHFFSHWEKFEKELNQRLNSLEYRNGMVIAKEDGKMIGFGTYTKFKDYLGNDSVLIHQVMTKKEDSYTKGIEEMIIKELHSYIKKTLKLDKAYYICPDSDSALRSIFMKLGIKKSKFAFYEIDL